MLKIQYSEQSRKFLKKISSDDREKIRSKIRKYAENPDDLKNRVKKLTGLPYYRLKVADYRIIFSKTFEILFIAKIGNRGDVYRGV